MKNFLNFLSILSLVLFASCGGEASEAEDSNASEAPATEAEAPQLSIFFQRNFFNRPSSDGLFFEMECSGMRLSFYLENLWSVQR